VPGEHGGLLFGGFADLTFSIYVAAPLNEATSTFTLANAPTACRRRRGLGELSHPQYARTDGAPYERKFSLDFAAGDAAVAPGLGSAQGRCSCSAISCPIIRSFLADVVPKRRVREPGGQHQRVAFYLNQSRRINWGWARSGSAAVLRGRLQLAVRRAVVRHVRAVRYPFTRFRRIVGEYRLERSDRLDIRTDDVVEPRRVGWLASNYLTYVKTTRSGCHRPDRRRALQLHDRARE